MKVGHTNNTYIAGGITAVPGLAEGQDNTDIYLKDTISSGRFLNNQKFKHIFQSKNEQILKRISCLDGVYSLKRLSE